MTVWNNMHTYLLFISKVIWKIKYEERYYCAIYYSKGDHSSLNHRVADVRKGSHPLHVQTETRHVADTGQRSTHVCTSSHPAGN